MKAYTTLLIGISLFYLLSSCYKDNEEELYGNTPCVTIDFSYSKDILPIIEPRCYNCHNEESASSLGANINIEGYDNLMIYVNNDRLSKSINHDPSASAMPKNSSKLSDCDINTIDGWIAEGAKNN